VVWPSAWFASNLLADGLMLADTVHGELSTAELASNPSVIFVRIFCNVAHTTSAKCTLLCNLKNSVLLSVLVIAQPLCQRSARSSRLSTRSLCCWTRSDVSIHFQQRP
jgi:hypothetical protein